MQNTVSLKNKEISVDLRHVRVKNYSDICHTEASETSILVLLNEQILY